MQCLNHCYLFPSCIVIQCKIENCASLMITVNRLAGNIFNLIHIYLDSYTQCMLSIKALQFYVEPLICSSPSHLPTLNLWSDSPIHSLCHLLIYPLDMCLLVFMLSRYVCCLSIPPCLLVPVFVMMFLNRPFSL